MHTRQSILPNPPGMKNAKFKAFVKKAETTVFQMDGEGLAKEAAQLSKASFNET